MITWIKTIFHDIVGVGILIMISIALGIGSGYMRSKTPNPMKYTPPKERKNDCHC